jgi:hypothetical protein
MKKYSSTFVTAVVFVSCALAVVAQTSAPPADMLQQKMQQMQQAAAKNEQQLRTYQWVESTSLAIDGASGPAMQSICSYATDGTILKTPLSAQEAPSRHQGLPRGPIMKHIVQKKKDKMEEDVEEIRAVMRLYLPFNQAKFKRILVTGTVGLQRDRANGTELVLSNYAKQGDQLRLAVNPTTMQVDRILVKTYFDTPEDAMAIDVHFSTLADATSYPDLTSIQAPSKKLSITTSESDFLKPAN